jgi:hypothetical protein
VRVWEVTGAAWKLVSCPINTMAFVAIKMGRSVRQLPVGVNQSDVAAGGAQAPPRSEGSRIRKVPSLEREKELLRIGPKGVDCCGSLCARNDLEMFSTPAY